MSLELELARAQRERFAGIDPGLGVVAAMPPGERVRAQLAGGGEVLGVHTHTRYGPGVLAGLWHARDTWELRPFLGDTGAEGMRALLASWRNRMSRERPGPDSACLLTWPSRDAQVARVLLDHGWVPLNCLAVRPGRGGEPGGRSGITVRAAGESDVEEVVRLQLAELRYSALVGPAVVRDGAAELLTAEVTGGLRFGAKIWLAESDGIVVGMASCGWTDAGLESQVSGRLPEGRWGFVGTMSVAPEARGAGVGRMLMAVAHDELNLDGVRGTFLYYNPPNPLSSVFWHRQGYRPLWTVWSVGPASALR